MAFLDETGLTYFWGKVKGWVNSSQHPVGSIYISTSSTFNPQTAWGGTWEKTANGRCLIGASDKYPLGSTGGEATHKLTTDEMPKHRHSSGTYAEGYPTNTAEINGYCTWVNGGKPHDNDPDSGENGEVRTSWVGGSQPHNNMQPYLAVYIWERTA